MNNNIPVEIAIFGTVIFCILAAVTVKDMNDNKWKQDAIKRGCAEYILNPDDGSSTWQWKEMKDE